MIEITNNNLFGKTIADALAKVENNPNLTSGMRLRWVNAISKAVAQIEDHGAFMTWQENETLLIWSNDSNEIYEANGVCQCRAYQNGYPCWHKAAKQLIKNYYAALETKPPTKSGAAVDISKAPYLKPNTDAKPQSVGGLRI